MAPNFNYSRFSYSYCTKLSLISFSLALDSEWHFISLSIWVSDNRNKTSDKSGISFQMNRLKLRVFGTHMNFVFIISYRIGLTFSLVWKMFSCFFGLFFYYSFASISKRIHFENFTASWKWKTFVGQSLFFLRINFVVILTWCFALTHTHTLTHTYTMCWIFISICFLLHAFFPHRALFH